MKNTKHLTTSKVFALAAASCISVLSLVAQDAQHLTVTLPGGMPGLPIFTGIQTTTNGLMLTWDGPSGYYQLYQKPNLANGNWQPTGGPNLMRNATITTLYSNAFFRVSGPAPQYAGVQACEECHQSIHDTVVNTRHLGAFTSQRFVELGGQTNSSCLSCHTVGSGLPTGFVSVTDFRSTNRLAGVQCENCHGPAGNHAANPDDLTVLPQVEIAATLCGGCHSANLAPASVAQYHPPHFEDWSVSAHHEVLPDLKEDFEGSRGPTVYIPTCGRCHSGSVREANLEDQPLPDGAEASAIGITCATCHDPHETQVFSNTVAGISYTNQVHNPLSSLQDYHTTGDFSTNYNANINICGQCHNDRGAAWTDTSRPPHHSPQYNMLLGTVGVPPEGVTGGPATHAGAHFAEDDMGRMYLVTNQCVTCHMQMDEAASITGHKFVVDGYEACAECHGSGGNAKFLTELLYELISTEIQEVKGKLDEWATNKAPATWQMKYGTRAWEYSTPGELSPGGSGPTSTEQQALLQQEEDARNQDPNNPDLPDFRQIQKARFNLYLVLYDGSYGVHNGPYAFTLLDSAKRGVQQELDK